MKNTVDNELYLLNNDYVYIYDYNILTYQSYLKMDKSRKLIYYQNNTLNILGLENINNSTYIKTYDLN
ncbi:hypothetical protein KHQ81_14345 [Mycoplasmatota bacterium]|nr:hypothetical protein KHQ81_14345 [Mycoplasmatota bacterium]